MSYPPPPGLSNPSYSKPPSGPSNLPARPSAAGIPSRPPTTGAGFKPAFAAAPSYGAAPTTSYSGGGFVPRQVAPAYSAAPSYGAAPATSYSGYPTTAAPAYGAAPAASYSSYPTAAAPYDPSTTYGTAPQIRNPFAPPPVAGAAGARGYDAAAADPEYEAQIAQWQSAYAPGGAAATQKKEVSGPTFAAVSQGPSQPGSGEGTSANAAPLGAGKDGKAAVQTESKANVGADGKTVVRSGGGTTWTDPSLLEWDPSHFRIFVGNLAGEVTDESLLKAFSKWPSVQKARVVRDKRTSKSKGYGFVSFSDGDDFFRAAREMNGKYVGSHPVIVKRATTEIKPVVQQDKRGGKGNKNKGKGGGHGTQGGRVEKAGGKTKNGLKILG